jgi:linoleoyl-CoA desaturase
MEKIIIPKYLPRGAFGVELKRRVDDYFESNKIGKKGDWRLYLKTLILFVALGTIYEVLVFGHLSSGWIWVPLCFILGCVKAGIGFCVMHDGIHGSYSKHPSVNYAAGLALNFLGGNNTTWYTKHDIIHHTNTNVNSYDEDIEAQPLLRLHPSQPWLPIHQYQHKWLYWIGVYSLLYFVWVWVNDYKKYFRQKILYKKIRFSRSQHVVFWVSKAVYAAVFVVLPIMQVGFWAWLVGYVLVITTTSILIAVVFQLAHVVEGVEHPTIGSDKREVSIHQVRTTADFATSNRFLSWFLGGLNFQVEHHLFPEVSHVHYSALHPIVEDVCVQYGVPLINHPTFSAAVKSHVAELRMLGTKPR